MARRPTRKTGKRKAAKPTPPPSPRGRRNAKGVVVEPQPFDNVERLRENADDAARLARTVYFTFLLVGVYIAVTIGSTTDLQLLKVSPVTLPIVNVGLPIVGFYALVPWFCDGLPLGPYSKTRRFGSAEQYRPSSVRRAP